METVRDLIMMSLKDLCPTKRSASDYAKVMKMFDEMSDDRAEDWTRKVQRGLSIGDSRCRRLFSLISEGAEVRADGSPVASDRYSEQVIEAVTDVLAIK